MEMMHFMWAPRYNEATSTYEFHVPLGHHGAIPMIHLDDLGLYARWLFDHQDKAAGMDLEIATAHVTIEEVARAFTKTTGHRAVYVDMPLQTWLDALGSPDASSAYQVDVAAEPGTLTWQQSFRGWWNIYRDLRTERSVITRDYELLDQVRDALLHHHHHHHGQLH
jgi:hypothetical protein